MTVMIHVFIYIYIKILLKKSICYKQSRRVRRFVESNIIMSTEITILQLDIIFIIIKDVEILKLNRSVDYDELKEKF